MKPLFVLLFAVFVVTQCSGESLRRVKRIIGGAEAEKPPAYKGPENAPVSTSTTPSPSPRPTQKFVDKEERSATIKGITGDDGINSFLGIRYAHPPIKRLRFQRPRKLKLKGEVDATRFGPACPQWFRGTVVGKEDCLFLNVFSPVTPGKYPVLLWIHGGNFKSGSGAQYYPRDIVRKGMVVVTPNYRLGSLGYLSSGRKDLPGNVGLFDIATAGKWVREYISYFGGDPEKIVLGGQGSGASTATLLALNGKTRRASKYSGVLAMSGTPVSPFALDSNETGTAQEVSTQNGCQVEEAKRFVRCMQEVPLDQIMAGDNNVANKRREQKDFPKGVANLPGPGPTEEGKDDKRFLPNFITMSPLEAIKKGLFPTDMPLMTGVTSQETGGAVKGNFLEEITRKLLDPSFLQQGLFTKAFEANTGLYVQKKQDPQLSALFFNGDYLKIFSQLTQGLLSNIDAVVQHTTDAFFNLPAFVTSTMWSRKNNVFLYSFEHLAKKSPIAQLFPGSPLAPPTGSNEKKGAEHGDDLAYLFDIRSLEGEPLNETTLDENDMKVKEHFTNAVWEFARSGKPRTADSGDWSPFKSDSGDYMIFSEQPKMAKDFHKCSMGLWTGDSGILSSPECSFLQATEILKSTLGTAGSSLLSAANSVESRLGIPGLTDSLTNPQATLNNVTSPLTDSLTKPQATFNATSSLVSSPFFNNNQNPIGGLFNPLSKQPSSQPPTTKTTKKPGVLGVSGLLG